jgi:uncharacterized membrane protein YfcA
MLYIILGLVVLLTLICVAVMFVKLKKSPYVVVSRLDTLKLSISGIIAFIADTIGVGSFAVNVALSRLLNTFPDDEMPAVNNGAQVIPGMIEAFCFLTWVQVDLTTLLTLVAGACIGGLLGGNIVSRLHKQAIRAAMIVCFSGIIILLVSNQLHLFPIGGDMGELHGVKLIIGFVAMMICGALTCVGIGLFAMVQAVLFLLNVSPEVAFPIMMTAGALQQPLSTLVFLKHDKIPLKKTLILSLSGCVGVFIALPIVTHLTSRWLHDLLLLILVYNVVSISKLYWASRPKRQLALGETS